MCKILKPKNLNVLEFLKLTELSSEQFLKHSSLISSGLNRCNELSVCTTSSDSLLMPNVVWLTDVKVFKHRLSSAGCPLPQEVNLLLASSSLRMFGVGMWPRRKSRDYYKSNVIPREESRF